MVTKFLIFRKLVCGGGELMGDIPTCNPLSQSFNYALDKPPTILFRHEQGGYRIYNVKLITVLWNLDKSKSYSSSFHTASTLKCRQPHVLGFISPTHLYIFVALDIHILTFQCVCVQHKYKGLIGKKLILSKLNYFQTYFDL